MDYSFIGLRERDKKFTKVDVVLNYVVTIIAVILFIGIMWLVSDFTKTNNTAGNGIQITQSRKELADKIYPKYEQDNANYTVEQMKESLIQQARLNPVPDDLVEAQTKKELLYFIINSSLDTYITNAKSNGYTRETIYNDIKFLNSWGLININEEDLTKLSYEDLIEKYAESNLLAGWNIKE